MKKVLFVVFASAAFVACNSSETKETKTDSPVVTPAPVVVDSPKVVAPVDTVKVDTTKMAPKMEEKKK
jgi:uncharacterized protein YcfL